MRPRKNPHTLKAYLKGLDLVPYVAVLTIPYVWAFWSMKIAGDHTPEQMETSWWVQGYFAMLLYVPSMAACGLGEWLCRRQKWHRIESAIRLFRWTHFAVAIGPIIILSIAIFFPAFGRLFF